MPQHHRAGRNTRKQATRIAVLAFVTADCAGIAYVQHRMAESAKAAEELAYAQPLVTPAAGSPAQSFAPTAPVFAMAAPAAVTRVAASPIAAAPVAASPVSPRLAVAAAPVAAKAPAHASGAAAPVLALGSAPAAAPSAHPLRAPRLAPAAGLGHAASTVTLAASHDAAPVHHGVSARAAARAAAPAVADSAFANAFSLDGEAPEAEHRFGQDGASAYSGNLADLVAPREEPAPIFDKAGIAPVTGQAATVDAPAPIPAELPAVTPAAGDAPATNG